MKIEEDDYEEEMRNKVSVTKKGRKERMTTRKKCVIKSTKYKRKEKKDDHEEEMRNKVNGTQKGKNTRMTTRKKKQR